MTKLNVKEKLYLRAKAVTLYKYNEYVKNDEKTFESRKQ